MKCFSLLVRIDVSFHEILSFLFIAIKTSALCIVEESMHFLVINMGLCHVNTKLLTSREICKKIELLSFSSYQHKSKLQCFHKHSFLDVFWHQWCDWVPLRSDNWLDYFNWTVCSGNEGRKIQEDHLWIGVIWLVYLRASTEIEISAIILCLVLSVWKQRENRGNDQRKDSLVSRAFVRWGEDGSSSPRQRKALGTRLKKKTPKEGQRER